MSDHNTDRCDGYSSRFGPCGLKDSHVGPCRPERKPLIDKSVEVFDEDGKQLVFAIAPFGNSETREERLLRLEELGSYDPDCKACEELARHKTLSPFMPSHRSNPFCRSGGRHHCTCDACF